MAAYRLVLLLLVATLVVGTHGGLLENIAERFRAAFKALGLKFLPGLYKDPTENQKFEKWQAPQGVVGGYTCTSKRCKEGGHMTGEGKKWDIVCQIEANSYHYCVPFKVDPSLTELQEVYRAMRWLRENTCVAFVDYQGQSQDFVTIKKGEGCSSDSLGKKGGEQEIELGPGCYEYPAITFHEMMHALGFEHLHQDPDREKYIKINFDNIDNQFKSQFKKKSVPENANLTFNYDSVLLYGSEDFQKSEIKGCRDPKCWTIYGKNGQQIPSLYTKSGPAQTDIQAINALYDCSAEGFFNPKQLKSQRSAPLEWHQQQQNERASGVPEENGPQAKPGAQGSPGGGQGGMGQQGQPSGGMGQGGGMAQQGQSPSGMGQGGGMAQQGQPPGGMGQGGGMGQQGQSPGGMGQGGGMAQQGQPPVGMGQGGGMGQQAPPANGMGQGAGMGQQQKQPSGEQQMQTNQQNQQQSNQSEGEGEQSGEEMQAPPGSPYGNNYGGMYGGNGYNGYGGNGYNGYGGYGSNGGGYGSGYGQWNMQQSPAYRGYGPVGYSSPYGYGYGGYGQNRYNSPYQQYYGNMYG